MKVSELSKAIEKELTLQQETSTRAVKQAVRETAKEVKEDISSHAPKGRTGKYAKSWRTKVTEETPLSIEYTVHAGKAGYPLAHLLEFGHAKRGGGRTSAKPHIKDAEQRGAESLEQKIRRNLK